MIYCIKRIKHSNQLISLLIPYNETVLTGFDENSYLTTAP
jgi:hypothetical protein